MCPLERYGHAASALAGTPPAAKAGDNGPPGGKDVLVGKHTLHDEPRPERLSCCGQERMYVAMHHLAIDRYTLIYMR